MTPAAAPCRRGSRGRACCGRARARPGATRFSTSAAGTSASTRTRDSGSSVTVVVTCGCHGGPPRYKRRMRRRFAAWLVTGPLGHCVAGVADWAELLARWQSSAPTHMVRSGTIKPGTLTCRLPGRPPTKSAGAMNDCETSLIADKLCAGVRRPDLALLMRRRRADGPRHGSAPTTPTLAVLAGDATASVELIDGRRDVRAFDYPPASLRRGRRPQAGRTREADRRARQENDSCSRRRLEVPRALPRASLERTRPRTSRRRPRPPREDDPSKRPVSRTPRS